MDTVRSALRSGAGADVDSFGEASAISAAASDVDERAEDVLRQAARDKHDLLLQLRESAERAGAVVSMALSIEETTEYVVSVVRNIEARSVVRSGHAVLDRLGIDAALATAGVEVTVSAAPPEGDRQSKREELRQQAARADVGITGVDYAIAETGSCVIVPRQGVSRAVSLLPPVHVAVVEAGCVLPSLDELFVLRRSDFLHGKMGSYMNIITGPSRSADIEYTIVKGVHGPGEVHLVLLDEGPET